MRWSFERFLTVASVDERDAMGDTGRLGDDGAGDDVSEDEGTIAGR